MNQVKQPPHVRFAKPRTEISNMDTMFGPKNINEWVPNMEEISDTFAGKEFFVELQRKWFFKGLTSKDLPAHKKGIDRQRAIAHLSTLQSSFDLSHEHKQAGVSYLMSLWFEVPIGKGVK